VKYVVFVALKAIIIPDFIHSKRTSRYEIEGVPTMISTHRIDKMLANPFIFI
jgi:branched-subunit amino acid transport protein